MVNHVEIVLDSPLSQERLRSRLGHLIVNGPFRIHVLVSVGHGRWSIGFVPRDAALVVRFGKVAELVCLLAREFEVHSVRRLPAPLAATA
jgi:hypothetical protein